MLFSATYACPQCLLRFERRARCPECGGDLVAPLVTGRDRARFRRMAAARHAGFQSALLDAFLLRLGEWAPTHPWIPLAFGALLFVPVVIFVARGDALDRASMGFAVVGALVASIAFVPRLAARAGERRMRAAERQRLRAFAPRAVEGAQRASLEGKVRVGSTTLTSPIGSTPCVAFGLFGTVAGVPLDDAEGADFDVEPESGERVLVSLEHAVLRVERPLRPTFVDRENVELDAFLDVRGVPAGRDDERDLAEIVLCDGDAVLVEGTLAGGAAIAIAYREGGSRVLTGTERAPVVVVPTKRCLSPVTHASSEPQD